MVRLAAELRFDVVETDPEFWPTPNAAELVIRLIGGLPIERNGCTGSEPGPVSGDGDGLVVVLAYRGIPVEIPEVVDDVADLDSPHDLRRALTRALRLAVERRAQRMSNLAGHAALSVFDRIPTYLTLLDANGNRLWSNPAVARDFQVEMASFIGTDYLEPQRQGRSMLTSRVLNELFHAVVHQPGATVTDETEAQLPGGGTHRFSIRMTNLLDDPAVGAIVVMTEMIPDAPAHATAVANAESVPFQTIVERGPLVAFINSIAPTDRIIFVSPQVERLLHLSVETLTHPDFDWTERIHPADRERIVRDNTIADSGVEEVTAEYRYLTGLGDYRWIRSIYRMARNAAGEPIWIGYLLDIESDRRLRAVAERHDVELRVLRQLRRLVTLESDLNVIFDHAVAQLADTFAYPFVHLYSRDDDIPWLQSAAGPAASGAMHPEHALLIGRASRDGTVLVAGPITDGGASLLTADGKPGAITGEIVAPLLDRDRVPGVLVVGGTRETPLLPADITLIETVAEYLSMATTRARLRAEAYEQGQTYQAVVERVRDLIFHLSANLDIRYANPAWAAALGYAPDAQVGTSLLDVIHPDDRGRIEGLFGALDRAETGEIVTETQLLTHDGQARWMELRVRVDNRFDDRREFVGMLVDITERRQSDEALRESNAHFQRLAFQDPLTGLPNRLVFHDRLQHALAVAARRGTGVAVLFLDLDGFKPVNDRYGHAAGDKVLRVVAQRLQRRMRDGDTIARFGGDEFAIILEDLADASHAMAIASELIESMQTPIELSSESIDVGVSIGVTYLGDRVVDTEEAVAEADAALYDAKNRGRGRYEIFDQPGVSAADGEYRSDLRRGIASNEIRMIYSPIYALADRRLVAVEARIRWDHPRYGRLIPGHFLRRADATGLLDLLGEHVFGLIARDLMSWHAAGLNVPQVRFTLSGRQALDADLLRQLTGARERFGFPGSLFAIELSDDGTSSPERAAVEQLVETLQAHGIQVGLDSYTDSPQAIAAILRLPFDFMNIDLTPLLASGMNRRTAALMRSFVQLAHDLEVPLVAKVADAPGVVPWLTGLGVTYASGAELGAELTPDEIAKLLAD